jgi:hypothetical protein
MHCCLPSIFALKSFILAFFTNGGLFKQVLTIDAHVICRFLLWKEEMGKRMGNIAAMWPKNPRYVHFLILPSCCIFSSKAASKASPCNAP